MVTMVNRDLSKIGYIGEKSLTRRDRLVNISSTMKDRYNRYSNLIRHYKILLKDENRGNYYKDNENYQKILKILSKYK